MEDKNIAPKEMGTCHDGKQGKSQRDIMLKKKKRRARRYLLPSPIHLHSIYRKCMPICICLVLRLEQRVIFEISPSGSNC
jgi:hypothetical protein